MTALITVNAPDGERTAASVQQEVQRIVKNVNRHLAQPFEQIRRFKVLERDFSLENGELTPTMKLRRARVLENFRSEIGELYAGREAV